MWRRQLPAYSPLSLRAVLAGLRGLWSGGEEERRALVAMLEGHFGAQAVLLTDSGTGALSLAIRACLAGTPGAAVALPAYSCYDIATAADGAGAPVLLYDLDPSTLAPDLGSLRRALEHGARAVVLAHLFGVPAEPEPVRAAAAAAGAWVIEDAAQGAGASVGGRPLGSFGDLVVLSFGRGKGSTSGRGGALLAHGQPGADLLARARERLLPATRGLKEAVQLTAQWLLGRPSLYAIPASLPFMRLGETVYHSPSPVRAMSAVAERTLEATWPLGASEAKARKMHAARLLAQAGSGLAPMHVPAGSEAGYLRLPFVATPAARAQLESRRARALGIMPGYPSALCDLRGFGERVLDGGEGFPGARSLAARLVTLPVHSLLADSEVEILERRVAAL